MNVTYQGQSGLESDQSYDRYPLDDHLKLSVDVGSNDFAVSATDAHIAGAGIALDITRTFDGNGSVGDTGDVAEGWLLDPGPDTSLGFYPDNTVYFDPTSGSHVFTPNGSGGWVTPPATDATLTQSGSSWTLTFNGSGVKDTFNSAGQLISRADRNGNAITLSYAGNPSYRYELSKITDTEGRVTSFGYTGGHVTSMTDPAGRVTTYGYDSSYSYLTSVIDTDAGVTTYGYSSPYGYLVKITTPAGRITTLDPTYAKLTVTQVSDPVQLSGPTTSYAYSGGANPGDSVTDTATDPDGHVTKYVASASRDEITSVTDALGHQRSKTYTPDGDVASLSDAASGPNTIKATYDLNNNLTKITAPNTAAGGAGASVSLGYSDATHPYQPSSVTDPQGNATSYSYNNPGDTAQVHNGPATQTAAYQGDPGVTCGGKAGQLCKLTDANGHATTYTYTSSGNLSSTSAPSPLGTTSFGYDTISRVTSMTDAKGQLTRYTYDGLDRLTQVLTGGATGCTLSAGTCVKYFYDGDGNLSSRNDVTGTTSWAYDSLGRVTGKTPPGSSSASTVSYDAAGNALTYTDTGGTVAYGYDAVNNLTSLAEPGGSCSTPVARCTTFTYDANNQRTQITYPSGETIKMGYDISHRETSVKAYRPAGGLFASRTYSYATATGADTELRQTVTEENGTTTSYRYDSLNRVTAANASSGPSYSYGYDPAGNLTTGSLGSHSYNAANQISNTGYSYDSDGNLTATAPGLTAAYNAANQTTSITPPSSGAISFTYAGQGQTERTQAGPTSYANTLLGLAAQTTSGAAIYFTRDPDGNLISIRQGSAASYTSSYYTLDALGSVLRLTDATGTTDTASYNYDPYGNTTSATGTLATNPYRYASGYYDSSTGLYHYGDRYYQPSLARWTQQDDQAHLGDLTQTNRYTYAGGDPITKSDRTGQGIAADIFGALGAVSFVAGSIATLGAIDVIGGVAAAGFGAASLATGAGATAGGTACLFVDGC